MRAIATALLLLAAAGCGAGDILPPITGGGYSPTGLPGAGGTNTRVGFLDTGLPTGWGWPFGGKFDGDKLCSASRLCGLGGQTTKTSTGYATFASGGVQMFFVSTKALTDTIGDGTVLQSFDVKASGIQRDAFPLVTANASRKLRLSFDYAFLLGRNVAGDSAVVQIAPAGGAAVTLFRVTSGDVGASVPRRAGDCGKSGFSDGASRYESAAVATVFTKCTDWTPETADISAYRGKTVRLLFITGEAGTSFTSGNTFLVRKVEIQEER